MGPTAAPNPAVSIIKSRYFTQIRRSLPGVDLSGQIAIITGGTSGLGHHCAHHLLSLKLSRLILAVRSQEKGESVADKLRLAYPAANVDVWLLEMTSYESIQAFCQRAETELSRLDFAILNAGVDGLDFTLCDTGHSRIFQVNYLSTFLLAILMLPVSKMKAPVGKPGRITIVSSATARWAKLPDRDKRPLLAPFDDPEIQKAWPIGEQYSSSKMLGHLFFARMIEYLDPNDVIVNLVEPGLCRGTDVHRDLPGAASAFMKCVKALLGRDARDGAWTYVDAAVVKGKESHGCFCEDWEIRAFTPLVYLPEGKPIMDALWEETLEEFEFAGARGILEATRGVKIGGH
ncbi:NAD(P)-binding protein [Thozetella sp. PMI_491]|nr:NAD(P)-binding protein [Thozetella sp. PMI_491]